MVLSDSLNAHQSVGCVVTVRGEKATSASFSPLTTLANLLVSLPGSDMRRPALNEMILTFPYNNEPFQWQPVLGSNELPVTELV